MIDQIKEGEQIENDQSEADEAERVAKLKEASEAIESERLERDAELLRKTKAAADDAWVSRSR